MTTPPSGETRSALAVTMPLTAVHAIFASQKNCIHNRKHQMAEEFSITNTGSE